jgi:hypothetical protein
MLSGSEFMASKMEKDNKENEEEVYEEDIKHDGKQTEENRLRNQKEQSEEWAGDDDEVYNDQTAIWWLSTMIYPKCETKTDKIASIVMV